MSTIPPSKQKIIDDIQQYGWHVIKVTEDDLGPGFGYSVGFFETFAHPEVLIIGLKLDLIHSLINKIGKELRLGKTFNSDTFSENVLDNFKFYFTWVDKKFYDEYVGQAQWYYSNKDFPLLQCLYPTTKGIYPWENEWPENIKNLQPILGSIDI